MKDRDIIILKKIIQYSNEIDLTVEMMQLDYDKFVDEFIARNAISMCILQIGELVGALSEEFKACYAAMPWRAIISMRNRAAHNYGEMDKEIIWQTAIEDIPELRLYCEEILKLDPGYPQSFSVQ